MDNVRHLPPPSGDDGAYTREPPHDIGAELALLGLCMYEPAEHATAAGLLGGGDFYRPGHTTIWRTLCALHAQGKPTDGIALADELTRSGDLQRVGGAPYLHTVQAAAAVRGQVEYYAEIITRHSRARDQIMLGMRLLQDGYAPDHDPETAPRLIEAFTADRTARTTTGAIHDRLIDGASFILDIPDQAPVVWGHGDEVLWAEGEALILAGPSGVGKTTLCQQVVLAAIGIRPHALGMPVREAKRVLYLASDRPPQAARSLRRMVGPEHREQLAERLVIWKGPPPADLARFPDTLVQLCRRAGADMVVLDSLKDMAGNLADPEIGSGINSAIQRTLVDGVEVFALHHHRKQGNESKGKEPSSLDELFGSTWITAGAGSVLSLWGAAGDLIVSLKHLKQPAAEVGPYRLRHDHVHGETEIWHQVDAVILMRQTGHQGLTAAQLAVAMFPASQGKPTDAEMQKARRKLDSLVDAGLAERFGGGKGRGNEARFRSLVDENGEIHL
ncbi:DnaB-like helicase N-terminal domain-containing protein [Embleya scabrispora]|uniref:DnaB-like helicase N-terminal domain-containing protein n=1 Tax=Embleya scabrispora TaxID=159449 RepID=UPI001F3F544A|nr:DnaB-like helicase N-terminal domain-containing protein [Embleya scabrispora]